MAVATRPMPIGAHGEGLEPDALTGRASDAGAGWAASGSSPSGTPVPAGGRAGMAPAEAGGAVSAPLPVLGTPAAGGTDSKPGVGLVPPAGGDGTALDGDTVVGVACRGGGAIGSALPDAATRTCPVTQTGV